MSRSTALPVRTSTPVRMYLVTAMVTSASKNSTRLKKPVRLYSSDGAIVSMLWKSLISDALRAADIEAAMAGADATSSEPSGIL